MQSLQIPPLTLNEKSIDFEVVRVACESDDLVPPGPTPVQLAGHRSNNWLSRIHCLVAAATFVDQHGAGHIIRIRCDNSAAVDAFKFGRVCDAPLLACARAMWYLQAIYQVKLVFVHTPGLEMTVADKHITFSKHLKMVILRFSCNIIGNMYTNDMQTLWETVCPTVRIWTSHSLAITQPVHTCFTTQPTLQ